MTYLRLPNTDPDNLTNRQVITRNDEAQKDIRHLLKEGYQEITREQFKEAIGRRLVPVRKVK